MSWVTDVLLIFSLAELFDENEEEIEQIFPLLNINTWLEENNFYALDDLTPSVRKRMQACVYGGSFNYFNSTKFIEVIQKQSWRDPASVLLLIQDEDDDKFKIYSNFIPSSKS